MRKQSIKGRMPKTKGMLSRLLKMLFAEYKWQLIAVVVCICVMSYASTIASIYISDYITLIKKALEGGGWASVSGEIGRKIAEMLAT